MLAGVGVLVAAAAGAGAYALTHDDGEGRVGPVPAAVQKPVDDDDAGSTVAPLISRGFIAQLASFRMRSNAELEAARLRAKGVAARVLRSSDYNELRSGFWVVFAGPFHTLDAAAAAAEASGTADAFARPITAVG